MHGHLAAEIHAERAHRLRPEGDLPRRVRSPALEQRRLDPAAYREDGDGADRATVELEGGVARAHDRADHTDVDEAGRALGADVLGVAASCPLVEYGGVPGAPLRRGRVDDVREARTEHGHRDDAEQRERGAQQRGAHRDRGPAAAGLEREARPDGQRDRSPDRLEHTRRRAEAQRHGRRIGVDVRGTPRREADDGREHDCAREPAETEHQPVDVKSGMRLRHARDPEREPLRRDGGEGEGADDAGQDRGSHGGRSPGCERTPPHPERPDRGQIGGDQPHLALS